MHLVLFRVQINFAFQAFKATTIGRVATLFITVYDLRRLASSVLLVNANHANTLPCCVTWIVLRLVVVVALDLIGRRHDLSQILMLHKIVRHGKAKSHNQLEITSNVSKQIQNLVRVRAVHLSLKARSKDQRRHFVVDSCFRPDRARLHF